MKRSVDKSACYIELRLAKQWMATYLRKIGQEDSLL